MGLEKIAPMLTDENSGLPPLHEPDPDDSILALTWSMGTEGLVSIPDPEGGVATDVPVRYISVRGLIRESDSSAYFGQVHVAVPSDALRTTLEKWLEILDVIEDAEQSGETDEPLPFENDRKDDTPPESRD